MERHNKYMAQALDLAAKAKGRTSPNPMVGALVVREGKVVGEGYHLRAGTPHAEIIALQQAGELANGADLYVTLEPCDHKGKTPPCTRAIIDAGIKNVYAAIQDPNPLVSGRGVKRLKNAGIEVQVGIMKEQARKLNEFFFKFITSGRPFVGLKTAMTLDGKIATRTGDSRWITGEMAREAVHRLRNVYDAILVGIGTVKIDDPMLNTRLPDGEGRDPVRLIIDGRLELSENSNIAKTARQQRTVVYTCSRERERIEELQSLGIEVVTVSEHPGLVPLEEVLKDVAQRGLMSVLIEAGSRINAYAIEHRLVDKVYWFVAPKICGGSDAPSPIGGEGIEKINDALELKDTELSRFGDDIVITGYL